MLLIVGGCFTGPIFDAGYMRVLVIVGASASVFGMMMTSICTEYWQIILAQGIVVGFGAGCMLLPSVAVMPQYFTTRRAFATGVGAAGSSIGKHREIFLLTDTCLRFIRWSDISHRFPQARTSDRIWLGNSSHRLHHDCNIDSTCLCHASQSFPIIPQATR